MDEFQKEVIDRLARMETKLDCSPCVDHGIKLENHEKDISKLRQKIDNKLNATKIWLLTGLISVLTGALGSILYLLIEGKSKKGG